ncbi:MULTISPECIES: DUF3944 domain-containing protein [Commensalibacter]|uniref:DUF3944 domain-containing protein n=1 Tax=Commensalibacter TaxID=1079922 RepID=UPI0018DE642B|nr:MULTISPECIES: DUF3944 domain-containing protein [Commensalibacter]MBH9974044.1 DUF3944 domain-containing protein [Commensalibacter melissae]MBI0075754.1 DUF3944 domain-containing protein [Commensalibacter sp. M0357]
MGYREDDDLNFLQYIKSEDLNDLVECITKGKNGELRITEELTMSDGYKKYYPDHNKYWKNIASEIQLFGANSIISLFRLGKGVLYREVLEDVCSKLKVNYNTKSETAVIERNLLQKIVEDSLENLSQEDKIKLAKDMGISDPLLLTGEALTSSLIFAFKQGGFKSYQLTLKVVNIIWKALFGKGLSFATNSTIAKTLSIATGPIGWTVTGLWTLNDIASPAYRVTIPSVIQVAQLRIKHENSKLNK